MADEAVAADRLGQPAADLVYEKLREAILKGDLPPNSRVTEADIARSYSVSRTPVREAFQRLKADSLLRESARALIVSEFSLEELTNICTVRDDLEALAAKIAATGRSDLDLIALEDELARFSAAIGGELDTVVRLNHSFHETIWAASHNGYLIDQLRATRSLVERLDNTTLDTIERQTATLEEHRAITDALRNHDGALAHEMTYKHFREASAIRLREKRRRVLDSSN